MAKKRDFLIVLDHAYGKTFEEIAKEHGISPSRAHQVYFATLTRLGLGRSATQVEIGCAIQRAHNVMERYVNGQNTPEWFYGVLREERSEDERIAFYRDL